MLSTNDPEPEEKMSVVTTLSNVRWSERRAEAEAWSRAALVAAKRRLAARWMPVVAASGILLSLVVVGSLSGWAALSSVLALLFAASIWPLDSSGIFGAIAGNAPPVAGVRQALTHLAQTCGRRRIAFVKGPRGNDEAQERFQVYGEAVADPVPCRLILGGGDERGRGLDLGGGGHPRLEQLLRDDADATADVEQGQALNPLSGERVEQQACCLVGPLLLIALEQSARLALAEDVRAPA